MTEQFTKYPLFGKANIIKDPVFGDWAYQADGCISSPVIGSAASTQDGVTVYNNVPVRPFSNGSEADYFYHNNCRQCARYAECVTPTDLREGGCALELRLALAWMGDGKIPFKAAKRIGFKSLDVQKNGVFVTLSTCKEKR